MNTLWHESLIWASRIGVALVFIGSIAAVTRTMRGSTLLQLLGSLLVLTGAVLNFVATRPSSWLWELISAFGGFGILIFAVGNAWYWLSRPRTAESPGGAAR